MTNSRKVFHFRKRLGHSKVCRAQVHATDAGLQDHLPDDVERVDLPRLQSKFTVKERRAGSIARLVVSLNRPREAMCSSPHAR